MKPIEAQDVYAKLLELQTRMDSIRTPADHGEDIAGLKKRLRGLERALEQRDTRLLQQLRKQTDANQLAAQKQTAETVVDLIWEELQRREKELTTKLDSTASRSAADVRKAQEAALQGVNAALDTVRSHVNWFALGGSQ